MSRDAALREAIESQKSGLEGCVHCGFCLPACPTYRRLGDEADSPRGRLFLMQAVVEGRIGPESAAFQEHIDRCLGCRACEPVCPSGVPYGHLLELARHVAGEAIPRPLSERVQLRAFTTSWIAGPLFFFARIVRAVRLPAALARILPKGAGILGRLRFMMAMLASTTPASTKRFGAVAAEAVPPSESEGDHKRGEEAALRVGILEGCVQKGLFQRVNRATRRVLAQNGYQVVRVRGQGCCGALSAHAGDLRRARALARRNIDAFEGRALDHVVTNASGCGATMAALHDLFPAGSKARRQARRISKKVVDVSTLLAAKGPVQGSPIRVQAAYDAPCHLIYGQGVSQSPEQVLRAIPGLTLKEVEGETECCGGAGLYGINHPELAGWIGGDKVDRILETGAALAVTGNPGCIMQIGAELRIRGAKTRPVHPVELLDESYRRMAQPRGRRRQGTAR